MEDTEIQDDGIMVKVIENDICLRRLEVIEALESDLFDKKKPIILFVGDRQACLTAIYVCKSCDRVHFIGGWITDKATKEISSFSEFEVYADITKQLDKFITVENAIVALKQIEDNEHIIFNLDNSGWHCLTGIFKCKAADCNSPHFLRGYPDDFFLITHDTKDDEFLFKRDILIQEEKIAENDEEDSYNELEIMSKELSVEEIIMVLTQDYDGCLYDKEDIAEFEKRGMFNFCEAIKQVQNKLKDENKNSVG